MRFTRKKFVFRLVVLGLFAVNGCGAETELAQSDEARNPVTWQRPELPTGTGDVRSVGTIDVDRYLGTWYEIASIPQWFQNYCKQGVRAEYAYRPDGNISVTNSCYDSREDYRELVGVAGTTDPERNAELSVSFVSDDPEQFGGDYWVLYVSPEYDLAVVGEPTREYGWILSRTPDITEPLLREAFSVFTAQGYSVDQFLLSDQRVYLVP